MTAVEWLIHQLTNVDRPNYINKRILAISKNSLQEKRVNELLEQAKEMEKQQHGKTWDAALDAGQSRAWNVMRAYEDFDDYYNETYESKGSGMSEKPTNQTEISDEEIKKFIRTFPYTKHLDDGQYNDGVIVGAELGIEWYREQLKSKGNENKNNSSI